MLYIYPANCHAHTPRTESHSRGKSTSPDTMTLLREVKRLRELLVRSYAMMNNVPMDQFKADTNDLIEFFDAVRAEPAIIEYRLMRQKKEQIEFRSQKAKHKRTGGDGRSERRGKN